VPEEKSRRPGTVYGDRNEGRDRVLTPPRGVGLTQPPIATIRPPAKPTTPVVPRREFDFEQKTPPAMDPNTYHALQTMRAEVLNANATVLELVRAEREERERRRKYVVPIITAVGAAIAGIVAAIVKAVG
jgi:hypothetical protein